MADCNAQDNAAKPAKQAAAAPIDLPTVVLRHDLHDSHHFDWLFAHPHDTTGQARLITFQTQLPPDQWLPGQPIRMIALPDHRRDYLQYEGPISGGRGRVARIAQGTAHVKIWTDEHRLVHLRLAGRSIRMDLRHHKADHWLGRVLDG